MCGGIHGLILVSRSNAYHAEAILECGIMRYCVCIVVQRELGTGPSRLTNNFGYHTLSAVICPIISCLRIMPSRALRSAVQCLLQVLVEPPSMFVRRQCDAHSYYSDGMSLDTDHLDTAFPRRFVRQLITTWRSATLLQTLHCS